MICIKYKCRMELIFSTYKIGEPVQKHLSWNYVNFVNVEENKAKEKIIWKKEMCAVPNNHRVVWLGWGEGNNLILPAIVVGTNVNNKT